MRRIDVGPRPTSRDELASWYAGALEAQAASGLSVAEYAGRIGVSVPTLYMWRRRLGSPRLNGGDDAKLIELTVTRPTTTSASEGMLVRVGDGRRSVVVPPGFDAAELRRLVEVLESC